MRTIWALRCRYSFSRDQRNASSISLDEHRVEKIVQFGEFQIGKSIMIPRGTFYLTPEPQFLGVFPVMYSLDVEENNQVEQFHKGWVMDELVGMAILNARGLVILRKDAA